MRDVTDLGGLMTNFSEQYQAHGQESSELAQLITPSAFTPVRGCSVKVLHALVPLRP
ncbi:MAG: hypothetical protein R2789_04675 [Microthrixaceae bacterium]